MHDLTMNKCTCPFEISLFNRGNLSIGSSSENKEADKVQVDTKYRYVVNWKIYIIFYWEKHLGIEILDLNNSSQASL